MLELGAKLIVLWEFEELTKKGSSPVIFETVVIVPLYLYFK
jgi:hypothetical protein